MGLRGEANPALGRNRTGAVNAAQYPVGMVLHGQNFTSTVTIVQIAIT